MAVKIKYGLDITSKKIKYISEVPKGEKCNCICLECRGVLIAKKGKIQKHHFQHKTKNYCSGGNPETLLHLIGKMIIKDNNEILLSDKNYFQYSNAIIEKQLNGFKPDVVVENDEKEIWLIEIAVTHFIDESKIEKIQKEQMNCIEIELNKNLIHKDLEAIKNDVLFNPKNRKIINDAKELLNTKKNTEKKTKWRTDIILIIIAIALLFGKQIKKLLKNIISN